MNAVLTPGTTPRRRVLLFWKRAPQSQTCLFGVTWRETCYFCEHLCARCPLADELTRGSLSARVLSLGGNRDSHAPYSFDWSLPSLSPLSRVRHRWWLRDNHIDYPRYRQQFTLNNMFRLWITLKNSSKAISSFWFLSFRAVLHVLFCFADNLHVFLSQSVKHVELHFM